MKTTGSIAVWRVDAANAGSDVRRLAKELAAGSRKVSLPQVEAEIASLDQQRKAHPGRVSLTLRSIAASHLESQLRHPQSLSPKYRMRIRFSGRRSESAEVRAGRFHDHHRPSSAVTLPTAQGAAPRTR
jgi:hypothetical protein